MDVLIIESGLSYLTDFENVIEDYFPEVTKKSIKSIKRVKNLLAIGEKELVNYDVVVCSPTHFEVLSELNLGPRRVIAIQEVQGHENSEKGKNGIELKLLNSGNHKPKSAIGNRAASKGKKPGKGSTQPDLMGNMQAKETIAIPSLTGFRLVKIKDIIAIEADRAYSNFHLLGSDKFTISKSLSWAEKRLADHGFYRLNRSWLINREHVLFFTRENGHSLHLEKDIVIPITDGSRKRILDWLESFAIID